MVGVLPKYRIRGRSNVSSGSPSSAEGHSFDTLDLGAIYTSELDRSQIDLSPKRSECECERSNVN